MKKLHKIKRVVTTRYTEGRGKEPIIRITNDILSKCDFNAGDEVYIYTEKDKITLSKYQIVEDVVVKPINMGNLLLADIDTLKGVIAEAVTNALSNQLSELKEQEDTLLTTKDLCELLQTTPVQLWRWEMAGHFTGRKLGGKKYYSKKEVLEGMRKTRKFGAGI